MFLKEVSYSNKGCIYLIKNTVHILKYYQHNYSSLQSFRIKSFWFDAQETFLINAENSH